ncbi:hypothetical protein AB0P21_00040 [Kribbella sp. NPDC056861]|uniref:hypothetical protein n=1 Tax=Kribbella sp. NPDC056861 TaxID=3154857 RepID=UPI00343F6042
MKPPRSVRPLFGKAPLEIATKDYESRLATWNEWQRACMVSKLRGTARLPLTVVRKWATP